MARQDISSVRKISLMGALYHFASRNGEGRSIAICVAAGLWIFSLAVFRPLRFTALLTTTALAGYIAGRALMAAWLGV